MSHLYIALYINITATLLAPASWAKARAPWECHRSLYACRCSALHQKVKEQFAMIHASLIVVLKIPRNNLKQLTQGHHDHHHNQQQQQQQQTTTLLTSMTNDDTSDNDQTATLTPNDNIDHNCNRNIISNGNSNNRNRRCLGTHCHEPGREVFPIAVDSRCSGCSAESHRPCRPGNVSFPCVWVPVSPLESDFELQMRWKHRVHTSANIRNTTETPSLNSVKNVLNDEKYVKILISTKVHKFQVVGSWFRSSCIKDLHQKNKPQLVSRLNGLTWFQSYDPVFFVGEDIYFQHSRSSQPPQAFAQTRDRCAKGVP